MSPTWKNNVYNLINVQSIVVHELEPAYGGQAACESLVDKTRQIGLLCTLQDSIDSKCERDYTFLMQQFLGPEKYKCTFPSYIYMCTYTHRARITHLK